MYDITKVKKLNEFVKRQTIRIIANKSIDNSKNYKYS